jgi:hypothetical protein
MRIAPRRLDSRSVGAHFVRGCQGRRGRSRRRRGDGRAQAASLVERTLLHDRAIHAATAAGASRAGRARCGHRIAAAAASARGGLITTAATGRRITAAAATMEESAAATAGGHQESQSDGEERETFHREHPFRRGRKFSAGENGSDCRSVDDSSEVSRQAAGRLREISKKLTGLTKESRTTCRKAGER